MKILCVAGDPGGARSVAAVVDVLHARGHQTVLLAYGQAIEIFREQGWNVLECEAAQAEHAAEFLVKEKPDACLTGTSINGKDYEKHFRQAAAARQIPSVAVLDFWSNYRGRFTTTPPDGPLNALADRIAVMDSCAAEEMTQAGFPAERLTVTGQPAFDELFAPREAAAARAQIRTSFGISDDTSCLLLFASQPFTELRDLPGAVRPPYDELEVLELVKSSLTSRDDVIQTSLWIRPHPREKPAKFEPFLDGNTFVSSEFDRLAAIDAADAVIGMSSAFLLEAALLGKHVLSLQPAQSGDGPLPLTRLGLGKVITRKAEGPAAIRELLVNLGASGNTLPANAALLAKPGAAGRVAELVIDRARQRQAS